MKRYEAYIFDLYGTLLDIHTDERKPAFWRSLASFYAGHGASYAPNELQQRYLALCQSETERLCARQSCTEREGEIDLAPVFAALYAEKGISADARLIGETAWQFRCASTSHLRAYAGAKELLLALRAQGARVFLLSNAQLLFTRPEMLRLGLWDCFDAIYISSACGWRKPSRQFIRRLLDEQRLAPQSCLMLGNDPNSDVAVAQSVGMDSFYLHSGQSPRIDPTTVPATYVQPRMDLRLLQKKLLNA